MKDISIVVPLYKGKKYIPYWLEKINKNVKIFYQNNVEISCELLFINDYPEEEISINDLNAVQYTVMVINSSINRGIHGARVWGLEHAAGEFVVFLDQDDLIEDSYLLEQYMEIGDKAGVVCKAFLQPYCMDLKYKKYINLEQFQKVNDYREYISRGNQISSPGQVLLRKNAISEIWKSNIMSQNGADDMLLWLLMLQEGKSFSINNKFLYTHVEHADNVSLNKEGMQKSLDELCDILKMYARIDEQDIYKIKNTNVREERKTVGMKKTILIYDKWFYLKSHQMNISDWLLNHGYNRVAIYGMARLGNRLYEELKSSNIEVITGIDQGGERMKLTVPIVTFENFQLESYIDSCDAIIVTVVMSYDFIKKKIQEIYDVKVLNLDDILDEMVKDLAE